MGVAAPERAGRGGQVRLLAGIALFWIGLYLYVPVLAPVVTQATGSIGMAGLVVASYGVPQFLTRTALALWSDRLGRRQPFLLGGLALVLVSSAGMALLRSGASFLVFRTLAGLAASTWAMWSIQLSAWQPAGQITRAMGWASFASNGGQVLATFFGGLLAQAWGSAAPFWCAAGVGAVGLLLMARGSDPPKARGAPKRPTAPFPWWEPMLHADVRVASLLGIVYQAATFVTTFGYVPLWASQHGVTPAGLGLLTATALVPAALVPLLVAAGAGSRLRLEALIFTGFALIGVCTAAIPWAGAGVGLFVAQGWVGVGRGLLGPSLMALAVRRVSTERRTTALATYQSMYALGMVGGPALAAGLVTSLGLGRIFLSTGALTLGIGGSAVTWVWWQRDREALSAPDRALT